MNFTTLEKVRIFLAKAELTEEDTALVNVLIGFIDGVIRNYCGWAVLADDYIKKYDGDGSTLLDLDVYPINIVTSCLIDGEESISDLQVAYEDGELYYDDDSGLYFTSGTRNITVTFNAGYPAPPDDLSYAASYLVVSNFRQAKEESVGLGKESFKDVNVEFDPIDLPILVKRVLDRYRKVKIV